MRTFSYIDLDGEHNITDEEIIRDYFPWWSQEMKKRGKEGLISEQNCIEDFCVVHWAHETSANYS